MKRTLIAAALAAATALASCRAAPPPASTSAGQTPGAVADPQAPPASDPEAPPAADPEAPAAADPEARDADAAGAPSSEDALVVYSGRGEALVGPLIERYRDETGAEVDVRWGGTGELAATLLEEGKASPADVFFAQDPGGLGAVEALLAPLPEALLEEVDPRFRDEAGRWIGVSGRVRVIVYNTDRVREADLPADLTGFTDPAWKGRLGWAPTNASFQTMVTAMRATWGEAETRAWLEGIKANAPETFDGNAPVVAAVGAGEIDVGFVNHYYLYRFLAEEGPSFPARNHFMPGAGPGGLVMVAGAGVLATARHPEAAERFLEYLVSPAAQDYFVEETMEYPVRLGHPGPAVDGLPPLSSLGGPRLDLSDLGDLQGTVALLRDVGALP